MSKGLIFTLDATIALGIFLASLLIFYSFFIGEAPFGLRGAGIYSKTDNYLYVEEISETFSSILNLYQKGDNSTAYALLELVRTQSEYPANIRMYIFNTNNTVSKVLESAPNRFSDKLVFKRYAVYTITRNRVATGTDVFVNAPTTTVNRTANFTVTVHNSGGAPINNVPVQLNIYNDSDTLMSWTITPPSQLITVIGAGANATASFNVTIPSEAWVDEYYAYADVGAPVNKKGTDPFNVVRFGLVEMEVGI